MPYVLSSGEIKDKKPWGLSKLLDIFWGFLNFFFMFFRTLISPDSHGRLGDRYTQDYRGPGGGGVPHHVSSESDLAAKLKQAGNNLVVIDFFATWCGPCKMIAPYIEELASEMPDVMFLKVDVDQCDGIAAMYQVRSMPTLVFIKNGKKLDSFSGANIGMLREYVNRYR